MKNRIYEWKLNNMNWKEQAMKKSDISIGTYYSFFIRATNKGDNLGSYAPVFEFEVTKLGNGEYCTAEIVKISDKIRITPKLKIKLEEYYLLNLIGCDYFKTREDAEKEHDEIFKEYFEDFSPHNREQHKDKLYTKLVSKIEKNSMKFYDGLTKTQKKYIQWLSNNKTF